VSDRGQLATLALPLALLALLAGIVVFADPGQWLDRQAPPPAPELAVDEVTFEEGLVEVELTNEGPQPVVVSQVLVNEAYWEHAVEPDRRIDRLETSTVQTPYDWVEGEPLEIDLVTAEGATVSHEVEAATATQGFDAGTLGTYTLIGLFVGVLPVAAGVAWQPVLQRTSDRFEAGLLAFTVGLLAFLGLDTLVEALELAERAPHPLGGPGLVLLGTAAAVAGLQLVSSGVERQAGRGPLARAYLVAVAIGLHNFGEGLVIGAAYAVGEVALGTFLILGFTLHNVTEGPAIVAPLREAVGWGHLAGLAAVGGVPTIVGAWIGGSTFTPLLGAVFFALGLGAIVQVLADVGGELTQRVEGGWSSRPVAAGALLGVAVMWATGVLI